MEVRARTGFHVTQQHVNWLTSLTSITLYSDITFRGHISSSWLPLKMLQKAGVSTATVSRVLNNHPSVVPETRQAVRDAMDFLCYVPSKSAIQLSGKCSGLIAVVLPNTVNL